MSYTCSNCGKVIDYYQTILPAEPLCNTCLEEYPDPYHAPKNNEQENKPQMSLIPLDLLAEFLVPAYEEGLQKYSRESWRGGFNTSIMMDACLRHLTKFYFEGEMYDQETKDKYAIDKTHLGAALFCILSILNTLKTRPELDDRRPIKEQLIKEEK